MNSLNNPTVRNVIEGTWTLQAQINPMAEAQLRKAMAHHPTPFSHKELVDLCAEGSFACPPEVGRLLYALVRAMRPQVVVEFGMSHGFSTLHIAAALRDNGAGKLVTTEMHSGKIAVARDILEEAELAPWVAILEGDAVETLSAVERVDMLYLDGWTDFYLDVLKTVEPNLRPGAFIQADDMGKFGSSAAAQAYLAYVREPENGYVSVSFSDYQGFEQSCWTGRNS
ncbi:methyltransferase [Desulfovibrio desulfuricans]|uniref:Methyltransferase n=1 Tax=Desulfovibrio desulfuricans TaxID=876 RepID=A0A4P7UR69_DESDE|nr:class I SAM-dependent methyltransferase [Desulfovibrio desulfuricans]QCC86142.1 methyltransferase [Desulfovibrio desulfuricans]